MSTVLIPVSPAELIDKITILEIKSERITDEAKLSAVRSELSLLNAEYVKLQATAEIEKLKQELKVANEAIWDGEEAVRKDWGDDAKFLSASRTSHAGNDRRFHIKRQINELLSSGITEVKSHQA
jgi:uncharacterized protein YPO0396